MISKEFVESGTRTLTSLLKKHDFSQKRVSKKIAKENQK
jgi:hypothetical protein